jgi:hypothetical protein
VLPGVVRPNKELLLQPKRIGLVPDLDWSLYSARRGSLRYREDSVLGELGAHGLVNFKLLPAKFRVR